MAALLIVASLFAGIGIAISQANAARTQAQIAFEARQQTEVETAKAKMEEEKAKKISGFMSKIIGYANPAWYAEGAKFGRNARVIDAIEDLSDKIDTEFAAEPDVAAELHHKFSEVFLIVGKNESGARLEKLEAQRKFHALRALELRKQAYGERHELVAKDLFYASYDLGETDEQRAAISMNAISMMREMNPHNLNLPYMLEIYTANLILPDKDEKYHEPYRRAVLPLTNENNYQIAEKMLRESLPIFREHYKEDNRATYAAECKLAYALAMQEKWTDFDEHFALCRQGSATDKTGSVKAFFNLVEKTLTGKNRPG